MTFLLTFKISRTPLDCCLLRVHGVNAADKMKRKRPIKDLINGVGHFFVYCLISIKTNGVKIVFKIKL